MRKKSFLSILVIIAALNFIFVETANPALETQLLVDVSPSTDNVPYQQTQWYGYSATAGSGYCVILTPSTGNSDLYLFDTGFNRVGYSKNSGLTADKVWYGQASSGPMHIGCYGVANPSTNFTIQVITSPYIKAINPQTGGVGTEVTITGFGFGATQGTNYVKFGTVKATNYTSWANTQIKVKVPSGVASGTIQVVVYVASRASNALNFTVTGGVSSDGTMWRYDLGRTGNYPNGPTTLPLNLSWSYSSSWNSSTSPVIWNGIVYVPIDIYIYALNANTGAFLYKYGFGSGNYTQTPAIANGIIYVAARFKLSALNTLTGALIWQFNEDSGYSITSSPIVYDGKVYFAVGNGAIKALDVNSGNLVWSYNLGVMILETSQAIQNGILYIGGGGSSEPGKIVALDAKAGSLKWIYNLAPNSAAVQTTPTVANGVVYIGVWTDAPKIYALDANTGTLKWQSASLFSFDGFSSMASLAYANGLVYAGSARGVVYAFDATNGTLKWSNNIAPDQYLSPASLSKGILYINCYTGLYALDAATGELKWQYSVSSLYSEPVMGNNGKVYISARGKVYCFAP